MSRDFVGFWAQWQGMVDTITATPPRFLMGIWCAYILLAPFYIFGQGLPQPADYLLLALGLPALFFAFRLHRGTISPATLWGGLFAALTLLINAMHYVALPDPRFVLSALYYFYNLLVFLFGLHLLSRSPDLFRKVTFLAIGASLVIQLGACLFFENYDGGRAIGTFNNPNQLAYWTLLNLAMLIVLKRTNPLSWIDLLLIIIGLYLQVIALSKAGLITTALLLGYLFFRPIMTMTTRLLILCILFGGIIYGAFYESSARIDALSAATQRIATIGQERDDSALGRGYARIIHYPHYLLFGAGEGGFERFADTGQELHSGLATLLFSYGLTGLTFFLLFLWSIFRRLPKSYLVLLGIILLFSAVHQGVRFTHFWIFLSVCYTARPLNGPHDKRSIGATETK